jgi:RNA polymerase subunit RPABC4/transcription elongation factor Spt4
MKRAYLLVSILDAMRPKRVLPEEPDGCRVSSSVDETEHWESALTLVGKSHESVRCETTSDAP